LQASIIYFLHQSIKNERIGEHYRLELLHGSVHPVHAVPGLPRHNHAPSQANAWIGWYASMVRLELFILLSK
jgi:hypothetical protein